MLSPSADNIQNSLQPRAGSPPRASPRCGVLESAWSPNAKMTPRGVHRRPNRGPLSLLFLVKLPVSD